MTAWTDTAQPGLVAQQQLDNAQGNDLELAAQVEAERAAIFFVYVTPKGQDLGKLASAIRGAIAKANLGPNVRVQLRGMVQGMNRSFRSFAIGFGNGKRAVHAHGPGNHRRLSSSVLLTVFLVPAAYHLIYKNRNQRPACGRGGRRSPAAAP